MRCILLCLMGVMPGGAFAQFALFDGVEVSFNYTNLDSPSLHEAQSWNAQLGYHLGFTSRLTLSQNNAADEAVIDLVSGFRYAYRSFQEGEKIKLTNLEFGLGPAVSYKGVSLSAQIVVAYLLGRKKQSVDPRLGIDLESFSDIFTAPLFRLRYTHQDQYAFGIELCPGTSKVVSSFGVRGPNSYTIDYNMTWWAISLGYQF